MYCWSYLGNKDDKELKAGQNAPVHTIGQSDEGLSTPKNMDELFRDFVADAMSGISRDISAGLDNGRGYSSFDIVYSLVESLSQFKKQMAGQESIEDKIGLFCASLDFIFDKAHSPVNTVADFEDIESEVYGIMNRFVERANKYGCN